jgi:formylglycine-generating enzyme required for sulfatase activity
MLSRNPFVACLLIFLLSPALANSSLNDCKNPATITLKKNVPMVFCTIPAMYGLSSFQIAQSEVTQLQYKAVMREEPWKQWKGRTGEKGEHGVGIADNNPAVYLTNDDAAMFADSLSQLDRSALYRLPTEDEWENAASGGTATDFYWGDDFKAAGSKYSSYAYCERSDLPSAQDVRSCPDHAREASEPGYCANPFGLMHMLGNVWEWTGTVTMGVAGRVIRGGGWYGSSRYCRSSVHSYGNSFYRDIGLGFRPVRIAKHAESDGHK